eukprot:TRINITY_DN4758_c0_g1_i1.p1 TRINITY_DN4758_c0_g1~~TRINITY_DN4758_c0_g1_i1.p1  ORF type:complete len:238 (+),score=67.57 TRINITY_DN4758_c0_g1_i1:66-716(+)
MGTAMDPIPTTLPTEQRLQAITDCKTKGNVELLRGKLLLKHSSIAAATSLQNACMHYARGLQHADAAHEEHDRGGFTPVGDMQSLETALYLNLAAANLLLEEWTPALACCTEVLSNGGSGCGDDEAGSEWWDRLFVGDAPLDMSRVHAGEDVRLYPEHARRATARALWESRENSRALAESAAKEKAELAAALRDPVKAELYEQLRAAHPDIPIHMR